MTDQLADAYPWKWWISTDEEHYQPTGTLNREDTIAEGRGQYGEDKDFYILEARQGPLCVRAFDADNILEAILNANEDNIDDDGEIPSLNNLTTEQEKALADAVNDAIERWMKTNSIALSTYRFMDQRNGERIEAIKQSEDE